MWTKIADFGAQLNLFQGNGHFILHGILTNVKRSLIGFIILFLSKRRFGVVLDVKPSQKGPVNAGVSQGSILGPTLFLLTLQ